MISIKEALALATKQLNPVSDSARLDAELILAHVLQKDRVFLYAQATDVLSPQPLAIYKALIDKRVNGTPIAYLIGYREFWSLELMVNENVLIPRPETELIVELCLKHLAKNQAMRVLDLGTGSGAIALALAFERPLWQVVAIDKSQEALKVANHNAQKIGLTNLELHRSHWFDQLDTLTTQAFDAIVSNPPYLASNDPHLQQGDVRFEPTQALVSGETGLDDLYHIALGSHSRLVPRGLLLLEHGYQQHLDVQAILNDLNYNDIQSFKDIHGHYRVTAGRR